MWGMLYAFAASLAKVPFPAPGGPKKIKFIMVSYKVTIWFSVFAEDVLIIVKFCRTVNHAGGARADEMRLPLIVRFY